MDKARKTARRTDAVGAQGRATKIVRTRAATGPAVKWLEVDHIGLRGHGVEFCHAAHPHIIFAFIVGCDFVHRGDLAPTVEIVGKGRIPQAVRAMVRRKVLSVVRRRGNCHWGSKGQIRATVNG